MKTTIKPKTKFLDTPRHRESELMVCCARVGLDRQSVSRIQHLVQNHIDWQYLIQLACQHGVMPLLFRSLDQVCRAVVPDDAFQQLRKRVMANTHKSLLMTRELIRVFTLFDQQAIAAVPYKGPILAAAVYGDVSLRQYGDIDIMVQQKDILPAQKLLLEQGYALKDMMTAAEEAAFLQSNHEHNLTFIHSENHVMLELHWRITPRFTSLIEPKHFWQNLEPATFRGANFLNLSLEDWLPILCVHGSRHRWERLTWLCDISEIIRLHPLLNWDAVIERSQVLVCRRMLFLGVLLAHQILDAPLPESVVQKMQSDREVMTLVAHTAQQILQNTKVSDKFLGKTIYQIRASDRLQEKALYLQSFFQWMIHSDKRMIHD
jgi:Uncharacterised nucleotidyltransferase